MGETIEKVKNQLNEFWQGTDKKKKMKLGIIGFLIVFSITTLIFITTRTNFEVLYTNLTLEDAGPITSRLDEMGIQWKTGTSETTILVPAKEKSKIKIALASEGLPKNGYSYIDAFNDSSWTMTEYDKKERIKYALKSTLENDISQIDGIKSARVYIDIPDDTGFVLNEGNSQAKASVFIKLLGRQPLAMDKIQAIKNLVAGAVQGMGIANVTVTDDSGRSYAKDQASPYTDYAISDQFSIRQGIETRVSESIRNFLENIFGHDNVAVRASVKVNFDSEITNIHQFQPPIEGSEEGLVRSMETVEEHMVNGTTGGVPGVDTNTEDVTDYGQVGSDSSKFDKASKVINYELNEINKQIQKSPGQIQTVTIAVLINKDALADGELTEERKKEISNLIYAATGLDTQQVEVNADSFKGKESLNFEDNINLQANGLLDYLKENSLITTIVMLALLGTIGLVINQRRNNRKDINQMLTETAITEDKIQDIDLMAREKSEITAQINKFVDKKPEDVAQLLKNWLNEE